jgi:hypothetical protein
MAKSPAAVKHGLELDMADDNDQKLYYRAVSRFTAKGELFDLAPERLLTFIEKLSQRAKEFGWSTDIVGIMFIPEDPLGAPTEMDNLLENYGSISMARIRAFEETYITTGTRVGQDTDMLYHCLMASLTEQAIGTLLLKKHEYTVNGEPSGNLLLRLIIRESSLDSNASSTIIRTKLSKLDEYMPVVKSDIKKFNTYVDTQIHALTARGETTSDLLVHLFAAYKQASDASFRKLAADEEIRHERGKTTTPRDLMAFMLKRWETLVDKGQWDTPSQEEEQLMVMRAELEDLRLERSQGGKVRVAKKTPKAAKTRKYAPDPDWLAKNIKPTPANKVAHHNGSPWYWCSPETGGKCEGCWRKHKPKECKGTAQKASATPAGDSKKLKLLKALEATIMDQDSDGGSESEEEVAMND